MNLKYDSLLRFFPYFGIGFVPVWCNRADVELSKGILGLNIEYLFFWILFGLCGAVHLLNFGVSNHYITHNKSQPPTSVDYDSPIHIFHSLTTNATIIVFGFFFGSSLRFIYKSLDQGHGWMCPSQLQIILIILFHCSEFLFVCHFHPSHCSWQAFLLDNGYQYTLCVLGSTIESLVWAFLFSNLIVNCESVRPVSFFLHSRIYRLIMEAFPRVRLAGFLIALFGLGLRATAFLTAQSNFTHTIAKTSRPGFSLVQSGIYSYCRHPSYLGWYLWAIGNPSSTHIPWRSLPQIDLIFLLLPIRDSIASVEPCLLVHLSKNFK